MRNDAAARERYPQAGSGVVLRYMWRSRCCTDHTRGQRLAAIEKFDVDSIRGHAHAGKCLFHVCHELRRSAKVNVRFLWNVDFFQGQSRQTADRVEILTHLVA